jgi:hypothetical protein
MQQSATLTTKERGRKSGGESALTSVAVAPSLPGTTNKQFDYDLPCQFGLLGCDLSFHLGEIDAWISHSTSHFRKVGPPLKCECTFCGKVFQNYEDPSTSWKERMIHIARHFQESGDNSRDMIIPHDIFVVEHLYRNGLLPQEEYDWVIGQTGNSRLDGIADWSEQTLEWANEFSTSSGYTVGQEEAERLAALPEKTKLPDMGSGDTLETSWGWL